MREVLFKNLTSVASRKKDITLKEVFQSGGLVTKTERRSFYYIKDIKHLESETDMQAWVNSQNASTASGKRHFYIFKEHSDKLGQEKILCKIAGTFYVIVDNSVFTIAFLHSFRATFAKEQLV
jgi:hypothetical protein